MKQAYASTRTLVTAIRHHREQPRSVGFDQDGAERWQAILETLDGKVAVVAAEVEKIMNDAFLTDQGKQDKVLTIGPRVVDNFKNVGVVLNQADQAKARLEKLIFSPLTTKPDGNEVVTFLREDRIRLSTGKGQAGAALLEAVDKGNVEVARAILDWPGGHAIPQEMLKRGREAFALRTAPEAWRKLEYVEVLRDSLSALATQVAKWLLLLGASPESVQGATKVDVTPPTKVTQMAEYLATSSHAK